MPRGSYIRDVFKKCHLTRLLYSLLYIEKLKLIVRFQQLTRITGRGIINSLKYFIHGYTKLIILLLFCYGFNEYLSLPRQKFLKTVQWDSILLPQGWPINT